ncbi:MAG: hypothetical protein QXV81_01740 [Ignisphaera sp.]
MPDHYGLSENIKRVVERCYRYIVVVIDGEVVYITDRTLKRGAAIGVSLVAGEG